MTPLDVLSTVCSMRGYDIEWSVDHKSVRINGRSYQLQNFGGKLRSDSEILKVD